MKVYKYNKKESKEINISKVYKDFDVVFKFEN